MPHFASKQRKTGTFETGRGIVQKYPIGKCSKKYRSTDRENRGYHEGKRHALSGIGVNIMAFARKIIRKRKLFDPSVAEPFKISRSKIELFFNCPRCFYLDQRLGIKRPDFPAFTLNSAVDHLLKKEFDIHRASGDPHPLMKAYKIPAVPFQHADLDKWRHNFTGVQYADSSTNFLIYGAVDDIWENKKTGELHVVDYKSTSTDSEVTLEGPWKEAYKRQMEIYQWLLRQNGFKVSDTGYFVYVNGKKDRAAFDGRLEFDVKIIPYKGDDSWVYEKIVKAKECLSSLDLPAHSEECEYCVYRKNAAEASYSLTSKKKPKKEIERQSNVLPL